MKQHDKHRHIDSRPPEGTVAGSLVYGPDPSTRAGQADLGNPLKVRKPWLFNGFWRNRNQKIRDMGEVDF